MLLGSLLVDKSSWYSKLFNKETATFAAVKQIAHENSSSIYLHTVARHRLPAATGLPQNGYPFGYAYIQAHGHHQDYAR